MCFISESTEVEAWLQTLPPGVQGLQQSRLTLELECLGEDGFAITGPRTLGRVSAVLVFLSGGGPPDPASHES